MANSRKFTLQQCFAAGAVAALLTASAADAAGLGRLNVLSQMGQPFLGEIDLVNATRDDLATLQARVAPASAYQAANLRFDPALNSLRISVQQRPNGTAYLRAATTRPIAEPYLDLVVELTTQNGKFQRQYAALLDPPVITAEPAAAPAVAAPSAPQALPVAPVAPVAPQPAARPAPAPRPAAPVAIAPSAPIAKLPAPAPALIPQAPAPVAPPKAASPTTEAKPAAEAPKPKPEAAPPAAEAPAATPAAAPATPKPDARESEAAPAESVPPPQAQTKAPPPPPSPKAAAPQRGIIDMLMDNLLPIGGGVLALLAGLAAWLTLRKRKSADDKAPALAPNVRTEPVATAPSPSPFAPVAAATAAVANAATATAPAAQGEPTVASVTDMVDPLEEAQVYLDHGAEEEAQDVLRKALVKEPHRQDVQLKLMEILAARGDKVGFNRLAERLHEQTGGTGASWERAMLLGAALDPGNSLYASAGNAAVPVTKKADDPGLDFDLGTPAAAAEPADPLANTTAILLNQDAQSTDMEKTMVLNRADVVRGDTKTPAPPAAAPMDFNFELPPASASVPQKPAPTPAKQDDTAERGFDFKITIPEVDLNLDDKRATTNAMFEVKSAQWEEVQQKFDLVLAYKEMGDKDGMLEALQEIEREGDAAQKAQAAKMLEELKAS